MIAVERAVVGRRHPGWVKRSRVPGRNVDDMAEVVTSAAPGDYEVLRAERDELRARLEAAERRGSQRHRVRTVAAGLLVGLAVLAFLVAMPGLWASRNLLDTDRFVSRAGPLVDDPAMQEVLATRLTSEVMLLVDPQALFEQVLPDRGDLLAVPLANAVEGFVRDRVEDLFATQAFAEIWVGALRVAHTAALKVLRGESEAVTASDGQVTLNLIPAIDAVLARITSASPEILGRQVDLPDVSVEDVPDAAIQRIEDATGVDLGDDWGQLTIYDQGRLETAQRTLDVVGRIVGLLLPVAVLSAAAALWVSIRRRRTLLQLAVGAALAAVVVRRGIFALDDEIISLPPTAAGRDATAATVDSFLSPLTTFAAWTIGIAAAVAAVAWITGPYPWAVAVRTRGSSLARTAVSATASRAGDRATQEWIRAHHDPLMALIAFLGVLALWILDLSLLGVLVVLALVAALLVAVHRIAGHDRPDAGAGGGAGGVAPPTA